MRRSGTAALLFLHMAVFSCSPGEKLATVTVKIGGRDFSCEVARSDEEKAKGLMNREKLGAEEGMIFVYDEYARGAFWMKNTPLPLSIAFLTRDGRIIHIADMKPFSERLIEPPQSYLYAIEVNQGVFEKLGVKAGDKVGLPAL